MAVTFKFDNNGYGNKISIRYYAEKRLKARPLTNKDGQVVNTYPLYIQVNAKQHTFQRKSFIGAYVDPELIDNYIRENIEFITEETNGIYTRIIQSPFFGKDHFSLADAIENYSALDEDICYKIGKLLHKDYCEAYLSDLVNRLQAQLSLSVPNIDSESFESDLRDVKQKATIGLTDRYQAYRTGVFSVSPKNVFGEVFANATPSNQQVCLLQERYGQHFWNLDNYCYAIRTQHGFPIVRVAYFLSPDFKKEFIERWGREAYESVSQGVKQLRADKAEFDSTLKSVGQ